MLDAEGPEANAGSKQPVGASPEKTLGAAARSGKEAYDHGAGASGKAGERELDQKRKDELPKSASHD